LPHTILHAFSSSLFSIGLVFITLMLAYRLQPTAYHTLQGGQLPHTGDVPGEHPRGSSSSLCTCELCDRVQSSRLDDRSGRHARRQRAATSCWMREPCSAKRYSRTCLRTEQEEYQTSTNAPLYLYLLREEGRRSVRVEVPREEAVDKLGLCEWVHLYLLTHP
jgi:hypothetical protein